MYGPGNTVSIDSRGRRQDAPIPVEQTLREPALLDRSSNTNYTRAVDTLTGSSPGRSQAPPDPHLPSTHNGMPSYTNAPTNTCVAADRFSVSHSTATSRHSSNTTPEAPGFPATSVPSVAPGTLNEHLGASSSSLDERHTTHEDAMSARGPMPPRASAMISHAGRRSQVNETRALTSPPIVPPDLQPTRDHSTDQGDVPSSHQDPDSSKDTLFLQGRLLSHLLRYMYYRDDKTVDETILLSSLEQIWKSHEQSFKLALEPRFDGCRKALRIWICLRRKTNELLSLFQRQSSPQTLDLVDRALAKNDIRMLHWEWEELRAHVDGQAMSPEDLLCNTFAIMTRSTEMETIFMEGLDNIRKTTPKVCSSEDSFMSIYS